MRFEDERYVRLYTRDTTTWLMLPWQSRAILPLILRKLDRAGILDLGADGIEALALVIQMPFDVVDRGLTGALGRGVLSMRDDGVLVWPKFIEGQEARQSDRARQKAARDRARDLAAATKRGVTVRDAPVTPRDAGVTNSDETVTRGHTASHDVTLSCAVPSLAVPSLAEGVQGDAVEQRADMASALQLPLDGDQPRPKAKGREGPIGLREDWQPTPEHAASVRAADLHLGRIIEDFRDHWRGKDPPARKTPVNWNRTFTANLKRILCTDWLLERFRMTGAERSRASWPELPKDSHGASADISDAEAQAKLDAAIADLAAHTTTDLLLEVERENVGKKDMRIAAIAASASSPPPVGGLP